MKSKPYYPALQKSIYQTMELTDHLTKLTKNLTQEIKLTLEGKNPIQHSFLLCNFFFKPLPKVVIFFLID